MNNKTNIYNLEFKKLSGILKENGLPGFRANQIWDWVYLKKVTDFNQMKNIDKKTIDFLDKNFLINTLIEKEMQLSEDKTVKLLYALKDGNLIETVLMPNRYGYTLCLTTQVGCKMGCTFCASGENGIIRNLSASEMILQYVNTLVHTNQRKITNIVLMGIGEPLDNYENVKGFLNILTNENKFNFASRKITLSTCGLANKLVVLAKDFPQVNIAISFHSPDQQTRNEIMPISRKYSIEDLDKALEKYTKLSNRQITLEYLLLDNVNDSEIDAINLSNFALKHKALVNLIPYNPIATNNFKRSKPANIKKFHEILKKSHVYVTLRKDYGADIDAACGQLRNNN